MNPAELSPAEMLAELWTRVHENCEQYWECMECGRRVCPRCEVSPAEPCFCAECHWLKGDEDA